MKIQKSVIFIKKTKVKLETIREVRDHCHYTGEDTAYLMENLVYLKKILLFFIMDQTIIIILL